jgi:hypothetical protein
MSAPGCVAAGGFESLYTFTAPSTGKLYLTLDADQDMGIYALDSCATDAVVLACSNIVLGGQVESTVVTIASGGTAIIVADGTGPGTGGPFELVSTFVPD